MYKKIFTVTDLYNFLKKQNSSVKFSSKMDGYEITVSTPGCFELVGDNDSEGLLYCSLKAFHDLANVNSSYIDPDIFKKRVTTMADRPIMADIVDVEDKGGNVVKDFSGHTMHIDEEQDKIIYDEIPIGHVVNPENIYTEYDPEHKRTFAHADCVIYEEYTDACDILRRRKKVDCSVELTIRTMSFDPKQQELHLDDYYVQGITLLGETYLPGMKGSNVSLKDFSSENNSVYFNRDELVNEITQAVIKRLGDNKTAFNADNYARKEETGQVNKEKFEELLAKYGKSKEDIAFEYTDLDDEALEKAFAEAFDDTGDTLESGDETVPEDAGGEDGGERETDGAGGDEADESGAEETYSKQFELSHDDIRSALYVLLQPFDDADNEWYWISEVFDDYFVYQGYDPKNVYKQAYKKDGDNVSFSGERIHMNIEYLTDSELVALNEMRSNYAKYEEVQNKLAQYKAEPQKMEILNADCYEQIAEVEEFVELKRQDNHFDMSVEDVQAKADAILLSYAKGNKIEFSATEKNEKKDVTRKVIPNSKKTARGSRYGSLFSKKEG